jgi:phage shock protein A
MLQYDKLQQQLTETEQKLSEQKRLCLVLEEEKQSLEEKYARLKMARLIDMADDDDLKSTRKRINRMIASVDKCLATLKVQ